MMGKTRIPGDSHAERQVFVETEIARQLSFHERKGSRYRRARELDFVDRMRRLELHPVHIRVFLVRLEPRDAINETAVRGVARITLRHDHEIGIELVFHLDRRAIARDGVLYRHDFHARALGLALALERLVVDAYAGKARMDAFAHEPPHRHDAAVPGV